MVENPLHRLSEQQIEALGRELDELHEEVKADLGDRDAAYIRGIIALHRRLGLIGRMELLGARHQPAWAVGTATLSLAKILENMEIGHNVLHGQWDWMNDPVINSSAWDWDTASTAEAWKHSHNYIHHTYTNIRGKDKDLGYEIMRIDPAQRWHPVYLAQPVYNLLLAALFEWGVALHDLDFEAIRKGRKPMHQVKREVKGIVGKAKSQIVKDYIAWPLVSALAAGAVDAAVEVQRHRKQPRGLLGRVKRKRPSRWAPVVQAALEGGAGTFRATAKANATSNIVRNVWAYAIIFCGHFPDQTYTFSPEEVENESRGGWYIRQLTGSANIEGSPLFHVASGNLSFQVEHHLFPDMPSSRYAEIAPQVKDVCERYGLPYNSGPFSQQLGMVQRTILRLAFPGGKSRPKPGPYRGN
jgi:linoleoyl-CoA desaturase